MRLETSGGVPFATILSFACHAVALGAGEQVASADYVGALRGTLEAQGTGPVLYVNGCGGDVNPAGMDSRDLTPEQLHEVRRVVAQSLGYLNRLRARMEQCGFPSHDRPFRLVVDAEDKMHWLSIELHYAACSGVGRNGR